MQEEERCGNRTWKQKKEESWRAEAAESRGGEVQGAPAEQMPSSALPCLQSCHDHRAGNTSEID